MKTLNFYFAVFVVLFLSSCSQKVANIKELYNSGEAFEIEFASWESFDQSALKDADMQTPKVDFFYSKKTNRVVVTFEDGRIGKYDAVKYNKIHSDDVQVCLQNDDIRFVIMNNGNRYALKLRYLYNHNWYDLAYFEDGKSVPVNTKHSSGPVGGVTILPILVLIILIGLLIWGIVKKKKWAIIIPGILLAVIIVMTLFSTDGKKPSSVKTGSKVETKVAVDSLWSATDEGYAVVYERPDGASAKIGKIYNDDKCIYPVYATEGPWYEIGFRGGVGYVYEKDCILQSGNGDI